MIVQEQEQEHGEKRRKRRKEGEITGFMSFMPTFEDGFKVIYLYEIHLSEELRGSRNPPHDPPHQNIPRNSRR
ncbi:3a6474f7-a51a-47dd-a2f9-c5bc5f5410e4 [Sclerotinia trifoliorum]|uniref:3a6474f7-a51a-47dd-a2f9-c5bc5f5410e4 n=1 Tax=Sclerotinia trifoliorum TaxID=28548 RepID=A0A8H2ZVH7_9HELO|nr:3a6474f7-a51a-47dd-a2f9-c5bc5f5410e4 [Sclerotinia trifoliorum]